MSDWFVGVVAGAAPVVTPPEPPTPRQADQWIGLSSARGDGGINANEASKRAAALDRYDQMAAQLVTTTAAELRAMGGRHVYDDNGPAATWGSLAVCTHNITDGFGLTVLNQKPVNLSTWASGGYDATFQGFLDSIPANHRVVLICHHEPENNTWTAAQQLSWRQGTARFAKIVYDHNDPNILYAACYIPGSAAAAWDWIPTLQNLFPTSADAVAKRTLLGFDVYPEVGNVSGTWVLQTLEQKLRGAINFYRGRGQTGPMYLPEVAFFNWRILTQEPHDLTAAEQATRLHDELVVWGQANELLGYQYYDITDLTPGDRSLTRILDTNPELLEYGKQIRGDFAVASAVDPGTPSQVNADRIDGGATPSTTNADRVDAGVVS